MEINNREVSDCMVLDILEENLVYPTTVLLKSHALELIDRGHSRMVLNLSQVGSLDSFGLAVIISILKGCRSAHGNLALYGLNDRISKLVDLVKLDRVLEIWETEAQAIHQVTHSAAKY